MNRKSLNSRTSKVLKLCKELQSFEFTEISCVGSMKV